MRIQSDIRVGSRTDKKQGFEDKVKAVERLLAEDDDDDDDDNKNDGGDDEGITYTR